MYLLRETDQLFICLIKFLLQSDGSSGFCVLFRDSDIFFNLWLFHAIWLIFLGIYCFLFHEGLGILLPMRVDMPLSKETETDPNYNDKNSGWNLDACEFSTLLFQPSQLAL